MADLVRNDQLRVSQGSFPQLTAAPVMRLVAANELGNCAIINIDGSGTVGSFGIAPGRGVVRVLHFTTGITLTHSDKIILPSSADIAALEGDVGIFVSLGLDIWLCSSYQRADGRAVVSNPFDLQAFLGIINGTPGIGQIPKYVAENTISWRDDNTINEANADGVAQSLSFSAITGGYRATIARSAGLDDISDTFTIPDEIIQPDPTTGVLRTAELDDLGKLGIDHANIRVGTRYLIHNTTPVVYVDFSASSFRGVIANRYLISNPQPGQTCFQTTNRQWYQYHATQLGVPAEWREHSPPPGWKGSWHTQDEASAHITATAQRVWWPGASTIKQVSALATDAQYGTTWAPEPERQELLSRPVLPAPGVAMAGRAVTVDSTGGGYDLTELFDGDYSSLSNSPTIPAPQVSSDWNATQGVAQILNKPTIPAPQVSSDWDATQGVSRILNKPDINQIPGILTDAQIPPEIARDTELFNFAAVPEMGSQIEANDRLLLWDTSPGLQRYATIGILRHSFGPDIAENNSVRAQGITSLNFVGFAPITTTGNTANITNVGEVNVQSDFAEIDTSADAFIRNKPTILTQADVDARVFANVLDPGEVGNLAPWPSAKHALNGAIGDILFFGDPLASWGKYDVLHANAAGYPPRPATAEDVGKTIVVSPYGVYVASEHIHHAVAPTGTWDTVEEDGITFSDFRATHHGRPANNSVSAVGWLVLDVTGHIWYESYKTNPTYEYTLWRQVGPPSWFHGYADTREEGLTLVTGTNQAVLVGTDLLYTTAFTAGTGEFSTYGWAISSGHNRTDAEIRGFTAQFAWAGNELEAAPVTAPRSVLPELLESLANFSYVESTRILNLRLNISPTGTVQKDITLPDWITQSEFLSQTEPFGRTGNPGAGVPISKVPDITVSKITDFATQSNTLIATALGALLVEKGVNGTTGARSWGLRDDSLPDTIYHAQWLLDPLDIKDMLRYLPGFADGKVLTGVMDDATWADPAGVDASDIHNILGASLQGSAKITITPGLNGLLTFSTSALDAGEVDARIWNQAETGNNSRWPESKISTDIARLNNPQFLGAPGLAQTATTLPITDNSARFPTTTWVGARIHALHGQLTEDFAETGTPHARVPTGRLGTGADATGTTKFLREDSTWAVPAGGSGGSTSGLNQAQVDARVRALMLDPGEVGNSDAWPVAKTSDLPASKITSGVFDTARLGTGTANGATFLRGDGAWATPPTGGGGGGLDAAAVLALMHDWAEATSTAFVPRTPNSLALTLDSNNLLKVSIGRVGVASPLEASQSLAGLSGTSYTNENARDAIADFAVAGDNIEILHRDAANQLIFSAHSPLSDDFITAIALESTGRAWALNIESPANSRFLGTVTGGPSNISSGTFHGGEWLTIAEDGTGLYVNDPLTLVANRIAGNLPAGLSDVDGLASNGTVLWAAQSTGSQDGLWVINRSSLSSSTYVGSFPSSATGAVAGLFHWNDNLYLIMAGRKVFRVNVTTPSASALIGTIPGSGLELGGFFERDGRVYATENNTTPSKLVEINLESAGITQVGLLPPGVTNIDVIAAVATGLSTTFVREGKNLYFTNERVYDSIIGTKAVGKIPKLNAQLIPEWMDDNVGMPGTGEANVQVNWNEADSNSDAFILNKPTVPSSFSDLTGMVALAQVPPEIARDTELFSGNYNDLTNRPTIPSSLSDLTGTPDLSGLSTISSFEFTDRIVLLDNSNSFSTVAASLSDFANYVRLGVRNDGTALSQNKRFMDFTGDGVVASGGGNTATVNVPGWSNAETDIRIAPWGRITRVGHIPPDALATIEAPNLEDGDRFYFRDEDIASDPFRYVEWATILANTKNQIVTWARDGDPTGRAPRERLDENVVFSSGVNDLDFMTQAAYDALENRSDSRLYFTN